MKPNPGSSLLLAACVAFLAVSCSRPPESAAGLGGIDEILQAPIAADRLAGVVAMAATKDQVLYRGAFGKKDLDSGEPMRADTIFQIASMTKPVTSVAVMQLVEQGALGLDEPLTAYLPEFANLKVLEGFDADGKPRLRDAARVPVIRELLSNTSGYAYSVWNENIHRYEATVKLPGGRERLAVSPLAFDPGARWEYGPSTDVLGILIESISGLTLEEYFRQKIFAPLGMKDSFFQASADNWPRVASRYQRGAEGRLEPPATPRPDSPPQVGFFSGGGGLMSTAPDYLRFVRALLNGGELDGARILQPETIDEMARNQIGDHGAASAMKTLNPSLSNDVRIFPGSQNKFGFGFLINTDAVEGGRAAGSLMWAGLYNTYFWMDRENGVCGVLMTQILPFADPAVLDLLGQFEQSVYQHFVVGAGQDPH